MSYVPSKPQTWMRGRRNRDIKRRDLERSQGFDMVECKKKKEEKKEWWLTQLEIAGDLSYRVDLLKFLHSLT